MAMIFIHLFALSGILLMGICFLASVKSRQALPKGLPVLLFIMAFLLRLTAAGFSEGFGSDTACFAAWAERICDTGPGGFYSPEAFTDYPPGYIYVLWLTGFLRRLLGIAYYSAAHLILLKLPSILSDLACGALLYREASGKLSPGQALFLCLSYLFNPAIILNSSVWGQVDSLLALAAVWMCLNLIRRKMYPAYIAFGMGLLIKPQMLLFGPVLLLGTIDWIWPGADSPVSKASTALARFLRCLFQCLTVAASGVILCLPFGPEKVLTQLSDTLGSYPYAAVNACNLWGLLGLNWISQDNTFLGIPYRVFGSAAIFAATASVLLIGVRSRNNTAKYPFFAAFTVICIYLFSVRMHERYLYPALALLLFSYVRKPVPLTYLCYAGFSVLHFYNTADVLFFYDPAAYNRKSALILSVSAGMLACAALLFRVTCTYYGNAAKMEAVPDNARFCAWEEAIMRGAPPRRSRKAFPLTKADIFCMLAITVLYSCFTLYDLGDRRAPVTTCDMTQGQSIELSFGSRTPASLSYYIAPWQDRHFALEEWDAASQSWSALEPITLERVFTWQEAALGTGSSRIRLTLQDTQASVFELVFLDGDGNRLVPENAGDYPALFDESSLCPVDPSFRNGMYFDEIYHGRTAYEFLHGLTSYENTHPPLGKIFIALGVAVFGMNPFGWRIAGALFGIAMVPVLYLFAKRIFGRTVPAALACWLFTFDFMHFTQTRLATIDVYVTFFILLMYYFLCQYSTLSFYDTSLKRTWLPLGACGVCMGLGIASKWTGIYAGAGLALLFFSVLWRRYREYLYAKKNPAGATDGISHERIIQAFPDCARKTILFCLVFFVAIPAAIYLLSYLPFRDYSDRGLIGRMLYNQKTMFSYHSTLESSHRYASPWYQWPVIRRPIWYYSHVITQTATGGIREGISAFGNPAVWWMGIPAFLYMLFLWAARKDRTAAFLAVGYLAQYLPWILVSRDTFIYHYFPSVGFVVLMIVHSLARLTEKHRTRILPVAVFYGLAVFALFLLFYPVLSGQPVEASFVARYLRWFDSWTLVAP